MAGRAPCSAAYTACQRTGSKGREATCEAGGEVGEASEGRVLGARGHGHLDLADENGGHDQAVDAENTRHNHGHDVLHHLSWVHDTHGRNAHASLCSAVCGAQVCRRGEQSRDRQSGREPAVDARRPLSEEVPLRRLQQPSTRAEYSLAKTRAAATPMKPKKAAARSTYPAWSKRKKVIQPSACFQHAQLKDA